MYSAIAFRAVSRFGKTVRETSSFFSTAKNDSAMTLSQHTPVRPIDPISPEFFCMCGELDAGVLRPAVGMENGAGLQLDVAGGHGDRVADQVGAHVLGHRPADHGLGLAVDDCGQVDPTGPGADVGYVADEPGSGRGDPVGAWLAGV